MAIASGSLLAAGALAAAATTAVNVVSKQDAARKATHAVQDQQKLVNALEYQPIDIAQLTKNAHDQAVTNATNSLALERQLQPDVADARTNLARSVSDQLKLGGQLPTDTINAVNQAGRVAGGTSGSLGGASVPLTAGLLGLSSLNLLNQRQQNAANLVSSNPLPVAGLDPGSLASLEAQQNAAQNQFNLSKAGVQTNLINSGAQASIGQTAANQSSINSIIGLLSNFSSAGAGGSSTGGLINSLASAYGNNANNPATNPIAVSGYS